MSKNGDKTDKHGTRKVEGYINQLSEEPNGIDA